MRPLPVPRTNAKMEIMNPTPNAEGRRAFTVIELLVVILIIGILIGFAFPAFQGVLERAKKVQAKNDLTQIVTAVNAFYTEYGKYPVNVASGNTTDAFFGTGTTPTGDTPKNAALFYFYSTPNSPSNSGFRISTGIQGTLACDVIGMTLDYSGPPK